MKYYTIHEMSEILGVTPQTLRNWDKNGKLKPHHTSGNGYRYYSDEQLRRVCHIQNKYLGKTVGYCRVSSLKQKDDLEKQVENMRTYLLAQGKPFEIIQDLDSSINYQRKGLQDIIKGIVEHKYNKVVVLYKDRLTRFGYELIEYIASLYDCEIEIVDTTQKIEQEELAEDLVQIITIFSRKLQGKRANKAKEMIKELIKDD